MATWLTPLSSIRALPGWVVPPLSSNHKLGRDAVRTFGPPTPGVDPDVSCRRGCEDQAVDTRREVRAHRDREGVRLPGGDGSLEVGAQLQAEGTISAVGDAETLIVTDHEATWHGDQVGA